MVEKLWLLIPEMILFGGVVVVMLLGLSPRKYVRDRLAIVTSLFLVAALVVTALIYKTDSLVGLGSVMPWLGPYVKILVCAVGVLLALLSVGLIDRRFESRIAAGKERFDPMRANRGEFFAFFLLSLMGVMLVCSASDLIWLFLALELTSLPTYVMVAMSRGSRRAQEGAVKYFFLGAMSSGILLYGFALLYGATGTIVLADMTAVLRNDGGALDLASQPTLILGMILAILGICFKIAAAPLHVYVVDVYDGAASSVAAFLAFVPKAAGMLALMLLVSLVGWDDMPQPILTTLWMIAVLTMTVGNIGALLQRSVKRMLAYSSIAHSGYMLIGIIAGPAYFGLSAVLFYLLAYAVMNTGAFAVLASLQRNGEEIETVDELAGLRVRHPVMAAVMAICAGSLLGVPPLLGFWGKLYLFVAGISSGELLLVIIAGVNSAISAWYYLRLVALPILLQPTAQGETVGKASSPWPRLVGVVTAAAIIVVPIFVPQLYRASEEASLVVEPRVNASRETAVNKDEVIVIAQDVSPASD